MREDYTPGRNTFFKKVMPLKFSMTPEEQKLYKFVESNKEVVDSFRANETTKFFSEYIAEKKQYYMRRLVEEMLPEKSTELKGRIKGIEEIEHTLALIAKARNNKTEEKNNARTGTGGGSKV